MWQLIVVQLATIRLAVLSLHSLSLIRSPRRPLRLSVRSSRRCLQLKFDKMAQVEEALKKRYDDEPRQQKQGQSIAPPLTHRCLSDVLLSA